MKTYFLELRAQLLSDLQSVWGFTPTYGAVRVWTNVPALNLWLESVEIADRTDEIGVQQVEQVYTYQITWARPIMPGTNPALTMEQDADNWIRALTNPVYAELAQRYLVDEIRFEPFSDRTEPIYIGQMRMRFYVWEDEHGI